MAKIKLIAYVQSEKRATSNPDFDSYGHNCAGHFKTGAHDRTGSEIGFLNNDHLMLIDAATRACEKMRWELKIVDVTKFSLLKRMRMKAPIPRLECNEKVMTGTPVSDDIIQFFSENNETDPSDEVIKQSWKRMVEVT